MAARAQGMWQTVIRAVMDLSLRRDIFVAGIGLLMGLIYYKYSRQDKLLIYKHRLSRLAYMHSNVNKMQTKQH